MAFETRDCYDDDLITEETPNGVKEGGMANPATGPLYVNGAMPGDVLKVEILDIQVRDWGVMRSSPTAGLFHEDFLAHTARIFPSARGRRKRRRFPKSDARWNPG